MVEKATVLVTAAGGIIGEGVIKSLRLANEKRGPVSYDIIAADASPQAAGLYRADRGFLVPGAAAPDYIERLVKLAKANGVSAIFVGADEELLAVASAAERIKKESGAVAITNKPETIAVGSDKWKTYEFMRKNGLPCAESALPRGTERFVKEFGFPVVVKPREGHGSEEFHVAGGTEELDHALEAIRKRGWRPMLQEFLGGKDDEFTTGVTVGKGKKVMSSIAMRRSLKGGQTYKAFIDDFPEVRRAAEDVAVRLGGAGPVNVQARMAEGEPKLFEINPRLSASSPIRAAAGVNEPDILYRNFVLGEEIRPQGYEKLVCLRYWNEVYVPHVDYEKARKTGKVKGSGSWIPDYF